MSHFTVLVSADNAIDLEEKLKPYYEQYGPDDAEAIENGWIVFDDKTEELQEDYENMKIGAVKLQNGELKSEYDPSFYNSHAVDTGGYTIPKSAKKVEVTPEEMYGSIDVFADKQGYVKHNGAYGWWHNPNAKWDWWVVGGRWSGLLMLKMENGKRPDTAFHGQGSAFHGPNEDEDRADTALVKDIDFSAMKQEMIDLTMETYDAYNDAIKKANEHDGDIIEIVRVIVEMRKEKYPDSKLCLKDMIGELKVHYHKKKAQEIWETELDLAKFKLAEEILRMKDDGFFPIFDYDKIKQLYLPREEYIKNYALNALTFAFVDTKGNWVERGNMGWWGMVTDRDDENYSLAWWDFVESLDGNQRVFLIDCHI